MVLVEAGDHRLELVHTPEETKARRPKVYYRVELAEGIFEEQSAISTHIQARHEQRGRRGMYILLETLGGLVWLLIGVLGVVAFSSAARDGAGLYGDPSPPPQPERVLGLEPAEARVIEVAQRLLTELRQADAWIARH